MRLASRVEGAAPVTVPCRDGALDTDRCAALAGGPADPTAITRVGPFDLHTGALWLPWPMTGAAIPSKDAAYVLSREDDAAVYVAFGPSYGLRWTPALATAEVAEPRAVGGLGTTLARSASLRFVLRRVPSWLAGSSTDIVVGERAPAIGEPSAQSDGGILQRGTLWFDNPISVIAGSLRTSPEAVGLWFATTAGIERVRWSRAGAPLTRSEFVVSWTGFDGFGEAPRDDAALRARLSPPRFLRYDGPWNRLATVPSTGTAVVLPAGLAGGRDEVVLEPTLLGRRTSSVSGVASPLGALIAGDRCWIPTSAGVVWIGRDRRWWKTDP